MQLPSPLLDGVLLERENRYRARVATVLGEVLAFVPNPGRTLELLYPGARVVLASAPPRPGPPRRTAYDLRLAYTRDGLLVSVDTRLASPLFAEALAQGRVAPLAGYTVDRPEVVYGDSRLDFRLTAPDRPVCLVEVKSSTLVEDGLARWPDSPSRRGQRHVRELARAAAEGYRAVVVWIVQRPDATRLAPHAGIDPAFAAAFAEVVGQGVETLAYTCAVTRAAVTVARAIPVELPR